jgi:hypothetical protein
MWKRGALIEAASHTGLFVQRLQDEDGYIVGSEHTPLLGQTQLEASFSRLPIFLDVFPFSIQLAQP